MEPELNGGRALPPFSTTPFSTPFFHIFPSFFPVCYKNQPPHLLLKKQRNSFLSYLISLLFFTFSAPPPMILAVYSFLSYTSNVSSQGVSFYDFHWFTHCSWFWSMAMCLSAAQFQVVPFPQISVCPVQSSGPIPNQEFDLCVTKVTKGPLLWQQLSKEGEAHMFLLKSSLGLENEGNPRQSFADLSWESFRALHKWRKRIWSSMKKRVR